MVIYTIRDIARLAGVSVTTVSRVLNHQPEVKPATRERVEQVMADCNFVGNANARRLKQNESGMVAVIMRGRENTFLNSLAESIFRHAGGTGCTYVTEYLDESADEFRTAVEICHSKRPAAIVFLGGSVDRRCAVMQDLDLPMVFVTTDTAGTAMKAASSVTIDDRRMGYEAMKTLLDLGHEHIAIMGGRRTGSDPFARRYRGAVEACRERGVRFDPAHYAACRFSLPDAVETACGLMRSFPETTAIFCMSDILAIGAMRGLADMGLSVPGDVSIFGFDGIESSGYLVPRLSTVEQPVEELAAACVEIVTNMLEHGGRPKHAVIPASLRIRESVGAPRNSTPHGMTV